MLRESEEGAADAPSYTPPFYGREAERPRKIPWRGWWQIMRRTLNEFQRDHIDIAAAGVSFYALLSIFPAMAVVVSIYGLMADPVDIAETLRSFAPLLGPDIMDLLETSLEALISNDAGGLSFGLALGVLLGVWSANRGMKALIVELNMAYNETEDRGLIRLNLASLGLTGLAILGVTVSIFALGLMPAVLEVLRLPEQTRDIVMLVRWPLLLASMLLFLAVIYRFAPSRRAPRWRWVTPGSLLASAAWMVLSSGFALYATHFGNYSNTYGTIGAVVILLMWFYISALIIGLGGELNAEVERQVDTPAPR